MALTSNTGPQKRDPRALKIVAKSIYRELIDGGFGEQDVMALAGELLGLVASEVREKRDERGPGDASS
jgi:hypothetical protein